MLILDGYTALVAFCRIAEAALLRSGFHFGVFDRKYEQFIGKYENYAIDERFHHSGKTFLSNCPNAGFLTVVTLGNLRSEW